MHARVQVTLRDGVQSRDCSKTNRFKEIAFFCLF